MTRLFRHLAIGALLGGLVVACATKPPKKSADAATEKSRKPSPTPTPKENPIPKPTPEVHFTATARVIGDDSAPATIGSDTRASSPPAATPSPTASPSPTATPKPPAKNFFTQTWAKISPPKATPTPAPALSEMQIHVSTDDGSRPSAIPTDPLSPPVPAPTPGMLRNRPTEGFIARSWHRMFPPKKAPPTAAPPAWLGTIRLINDRERYALIDAPNYLNLPPGEMLTAVGADSESGALKISSDRSPPFFIADIVSGHPNAGDRVYSPKLAPSP